MNLNEWIRMIGTNICQTMLAVVIASGLGGPAVGQECAYVGNQIVGRVRIFALPGGEDMGVVTLPGCADGFCQLTDLVVRPTTGIAYVSQLDASRLWIIDTSLENEPQSLPLPTSPSDVALAASGAPLYALSLATSELVVIDPDSATETGRFDLASQPRGLAVAPDGAMVATTSRGQNMVFFISTADGSTIQMGATAYCDDGTTACPGGDGDCVGIGSEICTGERPIDVALSPDGSSAYVASEDGVLTVVDVATGNATDTYTVGNLPISISVAAAGDRVFVANRGDDTVSIIDLVGGGVSTVAVGRSPVATALSSDGLLVVANLQGEGLSVIDTENGNTVLDRIPAGISPFALDVAPCPGGEPACAGDCDGDGTVAINELITGVNITLGQRPVEDCPQFDTDDNLRVVISELIRAVRNSLEGCSE